MFWEGKLLRKNICDSKLNTYLRIYNLVKQLGLRTSHTGTKLLVKAVLILIEQGIDFVVIEDIYSIISNELQSISKSQVKYCIKYAIDNRQEKQTIKNFEKIFGYEYAEDVFTNKELIEEIARVILQEII